MLRNALMTAASIAFCCATVAQAQPADATNAALPEASGAPAAANTLARGGNARDGYDMAPETRQEVVDAAVVAIPVRIPDGPVRPTWESLKAHYVAPDWLADAKFGLFLHWGVYAVPAHHNEWYEKHMYGNAGIRAWHVEHFGPPDTFGYKDFIPQFKQERFDPTAWAELFEKSGARYVIPTAQHHDNFALWDSAITPFNAKQMGPKRDLIGDLATAVRAKGLKFGVSNHGIENFQFINPAPDLAAELKAKKADLFDPKWARFYNVADRSDEACKAFLIDWAQRNAELIDKYRPDVLWFDNGIDIRYLDPLKLWLAAYYYNRAAERGQSVTLSTKKAAYAPSDDNTQTIGSVIDFEKVGTRSPAGIRPGVWQVDDPIGSTWGYTDGMRVTPASRVIERLVDTVSKNGNYLLNLSPKADGTIPQEQQDVLLSIGRWLAVNGEAIYGTHAWRQFGEGNVRGGKGPNVRYTAKGDALYAIVLDRWPGTTPVTLKSLGEPAGKITGVTLLGSDAKPTFVQTAEGLTVTLAGDAPSEFAFALKITGTMPVPSPRTRSGNPTDE